MRADWPRCAGWDAARLLEEEERAQYEHPDREDEREPVTEGRTQQEKEAQRETDEDEPAWQDARAAPEVRGREDEHRGHPHRENEHERAAIERQLARYRRRDRRARKLHRGRRCGIRTRGGEEECDEEDAADELDVRQQQILPTANAAQPQPQ